MIEASRNLKLKSMKKDTHQHSNYWIGNDLFKDDDSDLIDEVGKKSSNLMALASYKRAIGNFVNIVTNDNIKVKFDERGDSYTDGKTVTISAKMDGKDFDSTVGLALHEGSHIKLTDFTTLSDLRANDYPKHITYDYLESLEEKHGMSYTQTRSYVQGIVKDLINIIEDRRIDYYIYSTSPGYKGYYHAMYDKYFNAKIIDKGLASSEYRTDDWESYMFRICNFINENRDLEALPMLQKVWDMIDLKNIKRLENTKQVMELACEIFTMVEDTLPKKPQPENEDGDGESGSDENETGEDGEGNGGGGDSSEANGTDNTDGEGGESKDDSNGTDDSNGDADGDEVQSGSTSYNPNGAGGDGGNNTIAEHESKGGGNGKFTDRQKKMLENAIKKQKDFQNGDIKKKKVSKTEQQKLETLSKAGIEEKLVGSDYNSDYAWRQSNKTPVVVVRNFSKALVESDTIGMLSSYSWACERNQPSITKGIQIGTMLGRKLKLRSEERSLTTPRMKNGKISGRLLHELGMGNTSIFDQIQIDKHSPALVHISIDASSSMGGNKWTNSQTSAVAIAKAASMTPNLDVVISYRSIQGNQHNSVQPLMLIAYDSRKDKINKIQQLFQYLNPSGTTPEGLCFEAILDDIIKTSNGVDSYFINFSDGYPGFSNKDIEYGGDGAIVHTAKQVKKMELAGVKVLSYFISGNSYDVSYGMESFKQMYGKSAEVINVTNLIPLTKTLNKLFQ
tara:strand:- start:160 stop:2358 length:2199 start_codon:yes stop_codon:yes gene_type:complete